MTRQAQHLQRVLTGVRRSCESLTVTIITKKEVIVMPLNSKGKKIKKKMEKTYGKKKGDKVLYASENKGTIKGVTKKKK